MACFLVPLTEAVVVTVVKKVKESKIKKQIKADGLNISADEKSPFLKKTKWLTNLLWGGSALLAFEHVWHGEIVPWFPFLTAAANPGDALAMLKEMATVGVGMAITVTAAWGIMLLVSHLRERKNKKAGETV